MTKLSEGELLDLLPSSMKEDMECLSFALKVVTTRLLDTLRTTQTTNLIEELPEKVLDILAVDLRSPYYEQRLPIETKRDIISRTLVWHSTAGTPAAVEELVQVLFGQGEVVEWYDFTEGEQTPGLFDIVTSAPLETDILDKLNEMIVSVKNKRSHLRRVQFERTISTKSTVASACIMPTMNIVIGG